MLAELGGYPYVRPLTPVDRPLGTYEHDLTLRRYDAETKRARSAERIALATSRGAARRAQ